MLEKLAQLANAHRVALITYQKAAEEPDPRLVEPYQLRRGRFECLVRCYQLEPEMGWRQFKPSKLRRVEDGGRSFSPRRKIELDGEIPPASQPSEKEAFEYSDLLSTCLTDLIITDAEAAELARVRAELGIGADLMRMVHRDLYRIAIECVYADGRIDPEEAEYMRKYRACLAKAGYCP